METMCCFLIPDGMKSYYLNMKCRRTVFWKPLYKTRIRESDQLKTVLAVYDQDIIQKDMPPSFKRLKTIVLEQKVRARNFNARNARTVTETPAQCTNSDACNFRHDCSKRGASARSSSLTSKPQTNNDGKSSSKGKPSRGCGPSGKMLHKP